MGNCCSSSAADDVIVSDTVPPPVYEEAEAVNDSLHQLAHERLWKLQELDQATKIPFILVELTGEGDGEGEIEICGKDEYGIYEALDAWLRGTWECEVLDPGDLTKDTKIPFCKAQYRWPGFHVSGEEGLNNMGLKTMELIDFVSGQMSWTLAIVNGGSVGKQGEVREQQLVFKAPHPMNLVAPHMMIELRTAGFIEVSADLDEADRGVLEQIDQFIMERFQGEKLDGFEDFCNCYYQVGEGVFSHAGGQSGLGLLTTEVCDMVVALPGWSLVACNSGSYAGGKHREQQMVFRRDYNPLGDEEYLSINLCSSGFVEVDGKDQKAIFRKLDHYLKGRLGCQVTDGFPREVPKATAEKQSSRRYTWKAEDFLATIGSLTVFFELQGWELQVCSRQMISCEHTNGAGDEGVEAQERAVSQVEEQLLLFRPGATEVGAVNPHLFLELYAGEGKEELYEDEAATQVLANQRMCWKVIGPRKGEGREKIDEAVRQLSDFVMNYLGGSQGNEENTFYCNVFMCRGRFENNLAQWTMRLCDFLVDRLGWSFIVCSLCNQGDAGQFRSQQLVFRFDGDKRDMPLSTINFNDLDMSLWEGDESPSHWTDEQVLSGKIVQGVQKCSAEEKEALQIMLDGTFRRTLTRDRQPDDDAPENEEMPYRLELVDAFRSEHAWLHHRLSERTMEAAGDVAFEIKTTIAADGTCLASRLQPGQAYLYHGTNPSSAMSILKTGFVLDHAGSATGTMFGAGIYAAEASSKSDEYGRDDGGNTYPGLLALLICRSFVGNPYVVQRPGDYVERAREQRFDCICGDRESKVGTYREFVFFDERSVYPEYSVIYRRQYDPRKVPEAMVVPTTGTTGRFWQIKKGVEWKNLPTEVNKLLIRATKDGEQAVNVTLGGTEYVFDIAEKKGINQKSGNVVPLRSPMVF